MRREDREMKNIEDIINTMRKCEVCRLAINGDNGYPYIIPLNFGLDVEGEKIKIIFHSAKEGKKIELFTKDNRASFEMDYGHRVESSEERGYCTAHFESVIGNGKIRILEDDEKEDALNKLVAQYHPEGFNYNRVAIPRTLVYSLEVESITGKIK
ncbi:MFS transporter [Clostridiales bacterium S5-A14a]|nr:MFS transporter [Clostridiales bacterium S5-A14a]